MQRFIASCDYLVLRYRQDWIVSFMTSVSIKLYIGLNIK